jgi:hypothetical protein
MRRTALALFALLLIANACSGNEVSGDRRTVGGVGVTFSVAPSRAEVGRPVRFTLRLTNVTGKTEQLTFPTGQRYDFWVMDGDEEVWRWSDDRVFTQAITKASIDTQGTLVLTENWTPDRSGDFEVFGELAADGYKRPLSGELQVG